MGNVPATLVQGEAQAVEEQEQGAALASNKSDNLPLADAEQEPMVETQVAPPEEAAPTGPRGTNMIDVLPPLSAAPANARQRALRPEEQLATLIMGTPGMSGVTRGFAAQVLGRYRPEAYIPGKALAPRDLNEYRTQKALERLKPVVTTEE
jgi:hypothetical protein